MVGAAIRVDDERPRGFGKLALGYSRNGISCPRLFYLSFVPRGRAFPPGNDPHPSPLPSIMLMKSTRSDSPRSIS